MSIRASIAIIVAVLALGGCKTHLDTQVAISELLEGETKVISGLLSVEVASCKDYRDQNLPSSSLFAAQKRLQSIFPDAKYIECVQRELESFASFKIPLALDKTLDGKPASNEHINLVSNESVLLWLLVPEPLQKKIASVQGIRAGTLEMDIEIKVVNDTGAAVELAAVSAFVDGSPAVYRSMTVGKDGDFSLKLSDVSVQAAMIGAGSPVLYHPVKK